MEPQVLLRATALAVISSAFPATAAMADFSHTTCTSPKFMAYMSSHIGRGKAINGGKQNPRSVLYGPVTSATLVSNTGKTIVCEVTLTLGGHAGPHTIHGRFTGTAHGWQFLPAY